NSGQATDPEPRKSQNLQQEEGNIRRFGIRKRYCNLSVPFHGCLLDFGTCIAKPGQHCIKEVHIKGGIQWYSVKGCTENTTVCFKRVMKSSEIHTTHCCHRPLCNF
uniref:Uncharacterized protein n=1 Tax=Equus caballus TaxID=9796 RepID=A0A9L0THG9_HORSE